jgi:hypothetical protein
MPQAESLITGAVWSAHRFKQAKSGHRQSLVTGEGSYEVSSQLKLGHRRSLVTGAVWSYEVWPIGGLVTRRIGHRHRDDAAQAASGHRRGSISQAQSGLREVWSQLVRSKASEDGTGIGSTDMVSTNGPATAGTGTAE